MNRRAQENLMDTLNNTRGKEGFIFHTLHAFWYRFLVDAKVYQLEKNARDENMNIKQAIKEHYGIDV